MIDLLKKTLLTGIGAVALTKEKIEAIAKEFVEKGKITEQEGKALVEDLVARSEESRLEFQKQVEDKVESVMKKMNLAKQSELDVLRDELEEIRNSLKDKE
ncbi:MAG: hypothetical protein JKY62_08195 [Desulfocapsa sp.]|uniref:Polyhydroxyalkanoate synthesis regulator phasin n=1 Tax=Desulfotalea psychrophila TaxID=84980 RepID=A0ABS3AWS7_9BACT|nr:hypothetical protein [Desulfocapsa sp.]MBN4068342.1 hypothetical protein [Desulfotalea psychrophila]